MTMSAPALSWPDALLEILERQRALLDELAGLAERQRTLVAGGEGDALLALLGRRQDLVDRIVRGQERFAALATDLDARLESIDAARRDRLRALLHRVGTRLAEVLESDEADRRALEARRDEVAKEIAGNDAHRSARRAYRSSGATDGARFADRRG